jgi:hypothetical protein
MIQHFEPAAEPARPALAASIEDARADDARREAA